MIASGVHTVAYYARDAAGNVADGGVSNGRANRPPATATVKIDRDPPRSSSPAPRTHTIRSGSRHGPRTRSPDSTRVRVDRRPPGRLRRAFRRAADRAIRLPAARPLGLRGLPARRVRVPRNRLRHRRQLGFQPAQERRLADATAQPAQGRDDAAQPLSLAHRSLRARRLVQRAPARGPPGAAGRDAGAGDRALRPRSRCAGTRNHGQNRRRRRPSASIWPRAQPRSDRGRATDRDLARCQQPAAATRRCAAAWDCVSPRRSRGSAAAPVVFRGGVAARRRDPGRGQAVQLQFRLPGLPWSEFRTIQHRSARALPLRLPLQPTTTAAASASSSGPSPRRKPAGPTSQPAHCRYDRARALRRLLSAARDLLDDLVDEILGAEVCSSMPCGRAARARSRLRFRVVSTVRWRLRASRSTRLRVLRASVVALRRAVVPRRSVRLTRAAQLGAVGLELFFGGGASGERLDQIGDAVGDREHGADGDVDRGLGDGAGLVLLGVRSLGRALELWLSALCRCFYWFWSALPLKLNPFGMRVSCLGSSRV